jgi:hypothetical protein
MFRLVRTNTQLISSQCSVNHWQLVNATIKLPNQILLCNQFSSHEMVNAVLRTKKVKTQSDQYRFPKENQIQPAPIVCT